MTIVKYGEGKIDVIYPSKEDLDTFVKGKKKPSKKINKKNKSSDKEPNLDATK